MHTSCSWAKIGQMSGGKSIDPCCVSETFISPRQKSKLGAQQRPIGQGCLAWFVHLQFAPKKVSLPGWTLFFFWRFISILIPKTSCPERIYVSFSARFWRIFNCNQARWSKHVGWFFGDWCAPMFFLEDGNTWKNVQNMQNRRRSSSKVCLNACWLSMSSVWSLNLAGVRDQVRWCTLLFRYFLFWSIGFRTMAMCKIVCVCDLSVCEPFNLGVQVNPELGTQLCCGGHGCWGPVHLIRATVTGLRSWKVGIQVTETGEISGSPHRTSWNMIRDSCRSTWWLSHVVSKIKKPWQASWTSCGMVASKSCATGGVVHPIMAQHHQEKQIAPGNSTAQVSKYIPKVTLFASWHVFFSECLKNPRIHESPSTCVMLRKFHWLILAASYF